METNENENTMDKKLGDTAKAVLRGKYIAIQASLNFYILTSRSWTATEGQG